jgi:hypothetical protein
MGVSEQPEYLDFSPCWKQRYKKNISYLACKAIPAADIFTKSKQ